MSLKNGLAEAAGAVALFRIALITSSQCHFIVDVYSILHYTLASGLIPFLRICRSTYGNKISHRCAPKRLKPTHNTLHNQIIIYLARLKHCIIFRIPCHIYCSILSNELHTLSVSKASNMHKHEPGGTARTVHIDPFTFVSQYGTQ